MAKAKHLKLEASMILLSLTCLGVIWAAPFVALFERDWLYALLLAAPLAFGSVPQGVRPWSLERRIMLQRVYALAVGIFGLATGRVWLAIVGVLVPHLVPIALLGLIALAPQLFAQSDDVVSEKSAPNGAA